MGIDGTGPCQTEGWNAVTTTHAALDKAAHFTGSRRGCLREPHPNQCTVGTLVHTVRLTGHTLLRREKCEVSKPTPIDGQPPVRHPGGGGGGTLCWCHCKIPYAQWKHHTPGCVGLTWLPMQSRSLSLQVARHKGFNLGQMCEIKCRHQR